MSMFAALRQQVRNKDIYPNSNEAHVIMNSVLQRGHFLFFNNITKAWEPLANLMHEALSLTYLIIKVLHVAHVQESTSCFSFSYSSVSF